MWFYNNKEFTSEMVEDYVGFVYLVIFDNGKKYIGKKKFWSKVTRPPLKGKKRKRRSLKESDWKTYCGSSETVKKLIEENGLDSVKREILHLCKGAGELSYMEMVEQVERKVLLRDDYYNGIIQCRINQACVKRLKKEFLDNTRCGET